MVPDSDEERLVFESNQIRCLSHIREGITCSKGIKCSGQSLRRLIQLIMGAQKEIIILMDGLTNIPLITALVRRFRSGVRVKIHLYKYFMKQDSMPFLYITGAGIPLILSDTSNYNSKPYAVIDEDLVIEGPPMWTDFHLFTDGGTLLIKRNKSRATAFRNYFNSRWAFHTDVN